MNNWQTYSGFEWLLIDLASRFGKDKDLFQDRIRWAQELLPLFKVDTINELKSNLASWIDIADDAPHFAGAALAIWDAYLGNVSNWTVSQDAASSGAQLMSCLMKCETGMHSTGVLGTLVPDLYTSVHKKMPTSKISRKVLKKGMIPHMYASSAAPKAIFGDDYEEFLRAYFSCVPKAQILSDMLVDAWNSSATEHVIIAPDGFVGRIPVLVREEKRIPYGEHTFTYQYDRIGTKKKGKAAGTKSLSANTVHLYDAYVLRELSRRCNYNTDTLLNALGALRSPSPHVDLDASTKLKELDKLSKSFNMVSLVAIEYISPESTRFLSKWYKDKLISLIEDVLNFADPFEVKVVHDDFGCHPNHVGAMKLHYNYLLQETYLSKWLEVTLAKLTGKAVIPMQVNLDTAKQILDAPYSIG